MEEEDNTKGMAVVIILGFITLFVSLMTVMCSGAEIKELSFVCENIYLFFALSFSLMVTTIMADKKLLNHNN